MFKEKMCIFEVYLKFILDLYNLFAISFSYMLKYFQLQYLKRLQYTAKKMTGLSKVAKEANKGLKFLDTRYTQFTYMQKVISCLCSKFCFSSLSGRSFGDNTLHFMCKRLNKWRNLEGK